MLYQLIVIGEAVKELSFDLRQQHIEVSWTLIAEMRDHLIHGYDIVDLDEVWRTVTRAVSELLNKLDAFLPKECSEEQ